MIGYTLARKFNNLRCARLWTRIDEVDVRGCRGARSATLSRRRANACFDVRRRDAQSVSGSLGRQMLLLYSVIKRLTSTSRSLIHTKSKDRSHHESKEM